MEGRIIAIRVSHADFKTLETLKSGRDTGWNQRLLEPMEQAYGVVLDSVRPARQKATPAEAESARETKRGKKGGKGKGKGAKTAEAAETPDEPEVHEATEGELVGPTEAETGD